ncbi:photosystem reaction center subunit H [Salipiger aestuarii]|uniref:PRC-barrel domain-containing protein n=1 Tax=Salipiger aestuarii TaxID=568098 RepID=UPI00123B49E3|nr:PRC-barrel domain-containing protein [Salipiger aestuarii]KAA8609075.1 photosystem reaction center subunit H [Salipiger aestuarii]
MKRLTMTVAALALTAGGAAYAQTADETKMQTQDNMEQAETNLERAGENLEQAAENTGDAIQDGARNAGDAMQNAANDVDGKMNRAAGDTEALFANDADGLIRARDILGGRVYAENTDEMTDESIDNAATDPAATTSTDMASGDATVTTEGEEDTDMAANGQSAIQDNWDNVGEIEDLVFNADGSLEGIVAEVGGFLDIGDKHIHISLSDVNLVPVDDATYAIVVPYTKDQMMEMPDVDESALN